MCLRIYLNGDGTGRGSHLSLFFVVMRGQSDALLKWPFNQKVKEPQAASHHHLKQAFKHKFSNSPEVYLYFTQDVRGADLFMHFLHPFYPHLCAFWQVSINVKPTRAVPMETEGVEHCGQEKEICEDSVRAGVKLQPYLQCSVAK